ncbi:hypothetical protein OG885_22150 [Streptomyces sp. NBC_00028]|uniref:hypothetical protein n=1 Tax=Streptomyces sp. NBC_00028 TaxID=2975624 RepID=UPI003248A95E
MELTPRIRQRILRDFGEGEREAVEGMLTDLQQSLDRHVDKERITAATLLHAAGNMDALLLAVQDARDDWRDVLMGSGLEHDGWERRLDAEFGPAARRGLPGWRKFFG